MSSHDPHPSHDTVFALATPPGRSGVAVLRLSGSRAAEALRRLTGLSALTPRHAHYASFRNSEGALIDRGLCLYFPAPHSFTGEDCAELHLHGSVAVLREMLALLAGLPGLRHAEAGEFTRRAFLNGKLDLIEVEGLADLIEAETPRQKEQALRQLGGDISRHYDELRGRLLRVLAHLEAYLDFPEEDIPSRVVEALHADIAGVSAAIDTALDDHGIGERLRGGVPVVIVGPPNAGKSSLLNAMAGRQAAIVSPLAGTTRDLIEVHLDIAGFPVILIDTAGLRDTGDPIEMEGVRRARARAQDAALTLVVADGADWPRIAPQAQEMITPGSLVIVSKSDLIDPSAVSAGPADLFVSVQQSDTLEALGSLIAERLALQAGERHAVVTRARHRQHLQAAKSHLERALTRDPLELVCEELRLAGVEIGKITGIIAVDEILEVVFRSFCIGK